LTQPSAVPARTVGIKTRINVLSQQLLSPVTVGLRQCPSTEVGGSNGIGIVY
jgi:hypothetical protein